MIPVPTKKVNKSVQTPKIVKIRTKTVIINQVGILSIACAIINSFFCKNNILFYLTKIKKGVILFMVKSYFNQKKSKNWMSIRMRICLINIFTFNTILSFSQETPYYQLPKNRKQNHEMIVMPNLDAFTVTYFLAASTGIRKPFFGQNGISPSAISSEAQASGLWEIALGQNRNDNWIYEFGVAKFNNRLRTSFLELSRAPLVFTNEIEQYYAPFRVKKKILTLDKVSRNAFLNIGLGVSYLINENNNPLEEGKISFGQRPTPEPRDYTSLNFKIASSKQPIAFELLTEIRGKVSERLEISVFGKAVFRNSSYLNNQFSFSYVDGSLKEFATFEKPISIQFGLQAKFNSPKYYQYKSSVE